MAEQRTERARCRVGVVLLNMLTALLVVLDLPMALTAPMNVGMTEGSAGHPVLWAEALGALSILYPVVAAAGVFWSIRFSRSHQHDRALLCALAPYGVVAPLIVLVVVYW